MLTYILRLNFTKLSNATNFYSLYESDIDGLLCVNNNDLNLYSGTRLYHEYHNTCVIENTNNGYNRAWCASLDGNTYNTDYDSESLIFESFVSIPSGNDQGGIGFRLVNPANTFYWFCIRPSVDLITLYKCCYSSFFDVSHTSCKSANFTKLPNSTDLFESNLNDTLCVNNIMICIYILVHGFIMNIIIIVVLLKITIAMTIDYGLVMQMVTYMIHVIHLNRSLLNTFSYFVLQAHQHHFHIHLTLIHNIQ